MAIKEKMEQMIQEVQVGSTPEDAILKVTGGDSTRLRQEIRSLNAKARGVAEKYKGIPIREAVVQEAMAQCGDDIPAQFVRLSDMKRQVSLCNVALSQSVLQEQGIDEEFMRDSIQHTYEAEQEMAAHATPDELDALKDELIRVLPEDEDVLDQTILDGMGDDAKLLLDGVMGDRLSPEQQEDFSVMMAAAIMSEQPETGPEDASAAAAVETARLTGNHRMMQYLWVALPATLTASVGSLILAVMADISGFSLLSGVFDIMAIGFAVGTGVLTLFATAVGAYKAVKLAVPVAKELWSKCKPHLAKIAQKAKAVVLMAVGVLAEHVFRPAIHWVSNTALPVINEKVVYPMRRRLQGLLDWIKEKKDQLVAFVRSAVAPRQQSVNQDDEQESAFEVEGASEDEWAFAN